MIAHLTAAEAIGADGLFVDALGSDPGRAARLDAPVVADDEIDDGRPVAQDEAIAARDAHVMEQLARGGTEEPPAEEVDRQTAALGARRREGAALVEIDRRHGEAVTIAAHPQIERGGAARPDQDHPQRARRRDGDGAARREPPTAARLGRRGGR